MATPFPEAARAALANSQLRHNLGEATRAIRAKRARVVEEVPDWEALRDAGSAIKADVLASLDRYLLEFEERVTAAGGRVHWARDAAEANAVVLDVADSSIALATPFGPVGIALDGSGRLSGGFKGRLAVASPRLVPGRCAATEVRVPGAP